MGQVISVAQEKGGSGKSTLVALLAARFEKDGAKIFLLDIDPQKTSYNWAEKSTFPENKDDEIKGKKYLNIDYSHIDADQQDMIAPSIMGLKDEYDVVLVDTAGLESQAMLFVVGFSDLVLMPTKASEPDLLGMIKTAKKVTQIGAMQNKQINAFAVLCDVDKNTQITNSVKQGIDDVEVPRLSKIIYHRTKLKEFLTNGGYPEGNAMSEANELIGCLQVQNLLDFYKEIKEAV